jgi:hypothetical protein
LISATALTFVHLHRVSAMTQRRSSRLDGVFAKLPFL